MPNEPVAPNTNSDNWFKGEVPGGDIPFDELFPMEGGDLSVSRQPGTPAASVAEPAPTPAKVEPTPAPVPEHFLKAEKSIYKTADEAIRGINEKDATIEALRRKVAEATGVDPLTNKPVSRPEPAPENVDYRRDRARYMKDLAKAAEAHDEEAYYNVQAKLIQDTLAPVAPLIQSVAKQRAIEQASTQIPDFSKFRNSGDFNSTLEQFPELRAAIEMGESNFEMSGKLPELYRMAYTIYNGVRAANALETRQTEPPVNPTPVRTATPTTTTTPPQATIGGTAQDLLKTSQGRKALIEQFERGGVGDFKF